MGEMLATLVKRDRITQAQADRIVANVRKGVPARKQLKVLRVEQAQAKRADKRADRAEKRAERRAARG
jgi:hypothetical protein